MAVPAHTYYFERYCEPCQRTTVHRIFISGAGGELISIVSCINCGKREGNIA